MQLLFEVTHMVAGATASTRGQLIDIERVKDIIACVRRERTTPGVQTHGSVTTTRPIG